jgi:hypothetical protein
LVSAKKLLRQPLQFRCPVSLVVQWEPTISMRVKAVWMAHCVSSHSRYVAQVAACNALALKSNLTQINSTELNWIGLDWIGLDWTA